MGMSRRAGRQAAAAGQVHGRGQQDDGHGGGVDEGREDAGRGHEDHDQHGFALAREELQGLADAVGHARASQPGREDEHGQHGDDRRAAEPGHGLFRRDEARQGQGGQHHDPDQVGGHPAADEKDQGGQDDEQENEEGQHGQ
jgi:hypothetical protein